MTEDTEPITRQPLPAIPEMKDDAGEIPIATIEALPLEPPQTINSTRRGPDGRKYVAGAGPRPAKVMFLASRVLEEEVKETMTMTYGQNIRNPARYLKGVAGMMLKDIFLSEGIDVKECYYTAYVKCLMERKLKKHDLDKFMPAFEKEMAEVKPDVVICMGKIPFDVMVGHKVSVLDVQGAWFWNEKYKCRVYVMEEVDRPVKRAEYLERFRMDAIEVRRFLDRMTGASDIPDLPVNSRLINRIQELRELVAMWREKNYTIFSVDCEWKGRQHIDGKLRYFQLAWSASDCAVLQFLNEKGEYVFDASYEEVGAVLGEWLNQPQVKYVGHHISADFPWMHTWLGLEYYGKCIFDTEFGLQTVDEYEDLGLERISMKFTRRGRYDIPLLLWVKTHPVDKDDGYGSVPDSILYPYACFDVLVPMQAWPQIYAQIVKQDLLGYWTNFKLPFVTDIFSMFTITGLPVIRYKLDELRELYHWSRRELEIEFRKLIAAESKTLFMQQMIHFGGVPAIPVAQEVIALVREKETEDAFNMMKAFIGVEHLEEFQDTFDHMVQAPEFNIRATPQLKRWLFDVKKLTPIKSTNRKEHGLPSIMWERVMMLPPDAQKAYEPAVDKQTLQILGENDPVIGQLLELNAVGNVCKAFLKEGEIDPETGEVAEEKGLHAWIASDGRIHGMYSTTETGRPRSWNPNLYNLPAWVNDWINDGIARIIQLRLGEGKLPEKFKRYLKEKIPSVRSTIGVEGNPEFKDWCLVESDYETAELRGQAYISGDKQMIRFFVEKDPQFGFVKIGQETEKVRLCYTPDCGIPEENRDPKYIMALASDGVIKQTFKESDFIHTAEGKLVHTKYDLHWSLAEWVNEMPREALNTKKDRGGTGKVGNFSSAYGATGNTLERKIRADTGSTPKPGTGDRILEALEGRQPQAVAWLKSLEDAPEHPGYLRALSGAVRHFKTHPEYYAIGHRARKSILSALGREARNFFLQESVAATSIRAIINLVNYIRKHNLKALSVFVLYDSLGTLCPIEERFLVCDLHERFMFKENQWDYGDRILQYPIETEINLAWSAKPKPEDKKWLYDKSFRNGMFQMAA